MDKTRATTTKAAVFIGEDGSQGFVKGRRYLLKIQQLTNDRLVVHNAQGTEVCPYDSIQSLEQNWELLESAEIEPTPEAQSAIASDKVQPKADLPQKTITIADTEASSILDPNVWLQMKSIANDFFKSGVAPKAYTNPLQILMALQYGKEMGMQPAESLQSLVPINGQFGVWGKAVPGRLRKHGWTLAYDEGGEGRDQYCMAIIKKGDETFTETVSFGEVEDSGYTSGRDGLKPGWKPGLNRRLKLRYDVLDVLIKTYVPEVYGPAAGAAEVLLDIPAENVKDTTQAKIDAAVAKRKELTGNKFQPTAVESEAGNETI